MKRIDRNEMLCISLPYKWSFKQVQKLIEDTAQRQLDYCEQQFKENYIIDKGECPNCHELYFVAITEKPGGWVKIEPEEAIHLSLFLPENCEKCKIFKAKLQPIASRKDK